MAADSTSEGLRQFLQYALLDLYSVQRSPTVQEWLFTWNKRTGSTRFTPTLLYSFEIELCKTFKVDFQRYAKSFSSAVTWNHLRWRCDVQFDSKDPFNRKYRLRFRPPLIEQCTRLYSHFLGSDRFLFVSVSGLPTPPNGEDENAFLAQYWNQHWAPMQLFRDGIVFGGRRFVFFGGEVEKSAESASGGDRGARRMLTAWFYALHDVSPIRTLFTQIPLDVARDYLGALSRVAVASPGKCNARIKLGFSAVFPLVIDDAFVALQDDLRSAESGKVLTDGCGLIAADLAQRVPYAVSHGVVRGPRAPTAPLPAMLQVRCVCSLGLFKGCLLVTADPALCAPGTVVFRPSMRKADASPVRAADDERESESEDHGCLRIENDEDGSPRRAVRVAPCDAPLLQRRRESVLGVVSTFESPSVAERASQRDASDFSARLNRSLCVLLAHLGVPRDMLLSLLQGELDELRGLRGSSSATEDEDEQDAKSSAMRLARRSLLAAQCGRDRDALRGESDWDDLDNENENEADPRERCASSAEVLGAAQHALRSCAAASTTARNVSLGERVLGFLFAGHSLRSEPHLQQLVQRLEAQRLRHLARCNITVRSTLYLVGAPDPYGELAEDEVFILPPNDRARAEQQTSFSRRALTQQRVVVTRHPMQHPGDLRVFRAVAHTRLAQQSGLAEQSSGGVVFFSTRGRRAAADEMSGGDYDGDHFVVFCGADLVEHVTCVSALSEEEEAQHRAVLGEDRVPERETARACRAARREDCRCQECLDALGVTMFSLLLRDAQEQMVGRYSNAWLAHADALGPQSASALLCGHIVRVALDAAKNGVRVPFRPDLLAAPVRRHLQSSLEADELDSFSKETTCETDSAARDDAWFEDEGEDGFEGAFADLHVDPRRATASPRSQTNKNKRKSVLEELFDAVTSFSRDRHGAGDAGLFLDWDLLVVDGDDDSRNLTDFCGAPRLIDDALRRDIYQHFPLCRDELDLAFLRLQEYRKSFRERFFQDKLSGIARKDALAIKCKHRQLFEQDAAKFAQKFGVTSEVALLRCAGFAYIATYFAVATDFAQRASQSTTGSLPLSYCWEICGAELHRNKFQMEKRRQGMSKFENYLPSFLKLL